MESSVPVSPASKRLLEGRFVAGLGPPDGVRHVDRMRKGVAGLSPEPVRPRGGAPVRQAYLRSIFAIVCSCMLLVPS